MSPWPSRPVARIARRFVLFGFGVMSGSAVFVALALVPSWRVMSAATFVDSYGALVLAEKNEILMPVMGGSIVVGSIVAMIAERPRSARAWVLALFPLVALVVVGAITAKISVPINEWIAGLKGAIDPSAIADAQARWIGAHYLRTAVAVATFAGLAATK